MITLLKLAYVDGIQPSTDQLSLNWIQNGTLLQGATPTDPRAGNLNENSVRIQQNVQILDHNDQVLKTELESTQKKVATIEENIGLSGNIELIQQVGTNTTDVAKNKEDILIATQKSEENTQKISELELQVGPVIEQSVQRAVTEDLVWIKTELGQYSSKDINGVDVPENQATGLKYKFEQVANVSLENQQNIVNLQQQVNDQNVDELKINVNNIRSELGDKPTEDRLTIYQRLATGEVNVGNLQDQQNLIVTAIGGLEGETINRKFEAAQMEINQLQTDIHGPTGLVNQLNDVSNTVNDPISGLVTIVDKNTTNIKTIEDIVGKTDDDGIRRRINFLESEVGTKEGSTEIIPGSLEDRVKTVTSIQNEQASTIQDLQLVVGTPETGIMGDVANLTVDVRAGYQHASKPISVVTDGTFTSDMNAELVKLTKGVAHTTVVNAPNGVSSILANVNLGNTSTASAILVFLGTYDYLFNYDLGTIDDASADYSGTGSFYNSVYRLFDTIITATSESRVYVANGYKPAEFTGTTVKYPAANGKGHKLEDYALAIQNVAKMFSIPVIDTLESSNIGLKNIGYFSNTTGLKPVGKQRILSIVSKALNTK